MIPNILIFSNKNKGSSLMSPANGLGGSRATILFSFSKAAAAPAARALKQAGKKEEIRYEKKSSDFVNNLFNQTTGKWYSVLCFSIIQTTLTN